MARVAVLHVGQVNSKASAVRSSLPGFLSGVVFLSFSRLLPDEGWER